MRYQIWIVASSFIIFGLVGWMFLGYSPVYIALILFGCVGFSLGLTSAK